MSDITVTKSGSMQNQIAAPYDFKIGEVICESWQRVCGMKASTWGAIGLIVVVALGLAIISGILSSMFPETNVSGKAASGILQLIVSIVLLPLGVGLTYLGVRRSVDQPLQATSIFSMYSFFWPLLGTLILQYILMLIPIILMIAVMSAALAMQLGGAAMIIVWVIEAILVLAIIYFSVAFLFAYLLVVEKKFGAWAAFKASMCAFNQHWFKIIILFIALGILYVLSAIIIIGPIWTIPMILNGRGILYRIIFGVEAESSIGLV